MGVWASGYHPREVTGLWRPVLRTHPLDASGCPHFYFTQTSRESLANAIVTVMRQMLAMVVIAEEGRAHQRSHARVPVADLVPYGVERPRGRAPTLLVMDMNR